MLKLRRSPLIIDIFFRNVCLFAAPNFCALRGIVPPRGLVTFVPKVPYFTVDCLSESHRLRTRTRRNPEILDCVRRSAGWRCRSYVILHALRGPAPRFFDSDGKSKR